MFRRDNDGEQFTRSLSEITAKPLSPPQQHVPRAAEGRTQPHRRRDQNVGLPGLDLLEGPNVEIRTFGQRFLSHPPGHAFPAQVGAKGRKCF